MAAKSLFGDVLQRWLKFRGWSVTEFTEKLQTVQGSKNLRSKVNGWINNNRSPNRESLNAVLLVLEVDESTFWAGPAVWGIIPWQQDKVTTLQDRIIFRDQIVPTLTQAPIDFGVIFKRFLRMAFDVLEQLPNKGWRPAAAIGISREKLNGSDGLLTVADGLNICSSTNLDIYDLPSRSGSAKELSLVGSQIGWKPLRGGNLLTFLNDYLDPELADEPCAYLKEARGNLNRASAAHFSRLDHAERIVVAERLSEVQILLERALLEGDSDYALSLHVKFHMLLQENCGIEGVHAILQPCLRTPTRLAIEDNQYYLISQEQHRQAISLLEEPEFSVERFYRWHQRERAIGYSSAIFSRSDKLLSTSV